MQNTQTHMHALDSRCLSLVKLAIPWRWQARQECYEGPIYELDAPIRTQAVRHAERFFPRTLITIKHVHPTTAYDVSTSSRYETIYPIYLLAYCLTRVRQKSTGLSESLSPEEKHKAHPRSSLQIMTCYHAACRGTAQSH